MRDTADVDEVASFHTEIRRKYSCATHQRVRISRRGISLILSSFHLHSSQIWMSIQHTCTSAELQRMQLESRAYLLTNSSHKRERMKSERRCGMKRYKPGELPACSLQRTSTTTRRLGKTRTQQPACLLSTRQHYPELAVLEHVGWHCFPFITDRQTRSGGTSSRVAPRV